MEIGNALKINTCDRGKGPQRQREELVCGAAATWVSADPTGSLCATWPFRVVWGDYSKSAGFLSPQTLYRDITLDKAAPLLLLGAGPEEDPLGS